MGAIYIMWLRQIKRHFRSKPRVIGSLAQPLLFLVALGFGFGPVFQKAGEGSYINFLVPGIIAMSILFSSMFAGMEVVWDRQFGFLKETLVSPVSRLKIMIGRTLGGATVACFQGLIVLILSTLFGFRITNFSLLIFLFAILFTALGTAIASKLEDMQGFQLIMNFLIMPIFFLSGALFPLENLPVVVASITKFNPLSYGVDGLRWALTGASHFGVVTDFSVLIIITGIIGVIGSYLFSKIEI